MDIEFCGTLPSFLQGWNNIKLYEFKIKISFYSDFRKCFQDKNYFSKKKLNKFWKKFKKLLIVLKNYL